MRAADTNVLVRLLVRDDTEQVRAAEQFIAHGAWLSHLVLAESMWLLEAVYERTPAQIIAALDLLLHHAQMVIQEADVVTAAVEQLRKDPHLGFSDCLVLEVARSAGHLPLGTFDQRLSRREGAQRIR